MTRADRHENRRNKRKPIKHGVQARIGDVWPSKKGQMSTLDVLLICAAVMLVTIVLIGVGRLTCG